MAEDYGLLSGLAKGINAGMDAYEKAQDRQLKIKQYQDEIEVKKLIRDQQERGLQMEQTSKGLIAKPEGGYELSPEKQQQEQADLGYKKAQTEGLLANAMKDRAAALQPKPMSDPELKAASELRREFQSRPGVKDFNVIKTAYQKIAAAEKNPSAAGDLSLIFSYNKILDPQSTVREGEFANAQNAAGWSDQMRNMYNRAMSGERLNPAQRSDFIKQAKAQAQAQAQSLQEIENEFGDLSKRYKVDPSLIYQPQAGGLLSQKADSAVAPQEIDQAMAWANANPNDPRAKAIKQRLGK